MHAPKAWHECMHSVHLERKSSTQKHLFVNLQLQRLNIHVANIQLPLLQHGVEPGSPVGTTLRRSLRNRFGHRKQAYAVRGPFVVMPAVTDACTYTHMHTYTRTCTHTHAHTLIYRHTHEQLARRRAAQNSNESPYRLAIALLTHTLEVGTSGARPTINVVPPIRIVTASGRSPPARASAPPAPPPAFRVIPPIPTATARGR